MMYLVHDLLSLEGEGMVQEINAIQCYSAECLTTFTYLPFA